MNVCQPRSREPRVRAKRNTKKKKKETETEIKGGEETVL